MSNASLSEAELEFCYFGLYRVLKRYRWATMLGWCIVLLGIAGIPLGWRFGTPHGLIDIVLSVATVLAGLSVVQLGVVSLQSYVKVPFRSRHENGGDKHSPIVVEIEALMEEIDEGGWQEAYSAIGRLRNMGASYGLPNLE